MTVERSTSVHVVTCHYSEYFFLKVHPSTGSEYCQHSDTISCYVSAWRELRFHRGMTASVHSEAQPEGIGDGFYVSTVYPGL